MREITELFIQDWTKYTEAMLSLRYFAQDELGEITNRVERWLYNNICRTERNIAYEESPERSLLHSRTVVLDIDSRDLSNFMAADQIVQKIEALIRVSTLFWSIVRPLHTRFRLWRNTN
ncbi:MAG: hypothetical protein IPF81_03390 [Bacteroidetes bacterium]|nr:hypothetical protein [Bacteroidota bacterium]